MPGIGSGTGEEKLEEAQGLQANQNAKPQGAGSGCGAGSNGSGSDITASRTTPLGGKK